MGKIRACADVHLLLLQWAEPVRTAALKVRLPAPLPCPPDPYYACPSRPSPHPGHVPPCPPSRPCALQSLVVLLGHKFPRVRKYTAEALYVQMLSDPHAVGPPATGADTTGAATEEQNEEPATVSSGGGGGGGDADADMVEERWSGFAATAAQLDRVSDLLASTAWDGANLADARARRLELCELMGLKMTVKAPAAGAGAGGARAAAKQRPKADELDSYEALVREAGY